MSILLQNFVQVAQGARSKPLQAASVPGGVTHRWQAEWLRRCRFSYVQILIIVVTLALLAVFTLLVSQHPARAAPSAPASRTRRWRRCCGIDVDRAISLTFVIGAALAAVAGLHVPAATTASSTSSSASWPASKAFTAAVLGGIGSPAGRDAGRAADRPDRDLCGSAYFSVRVQGRRGLRASWC
jgi:branched-chain amino acid transport system permease protein